MKRILQIVMLGLLAVATLAVPTGPAHATAEPDPLTETAPAEGSTVTGAGDVSAPGEMTLAGSNRFVCGDGAAGYYRCLSIRQAMRRDGYRLGGLNYHPPGCTGPGGCWGVGWWFTYYW